MQPSTTPTAAPALPPREIGVLGAAALVAGAMVGSGIYLVPAALGAVGAISLLGWAAAMVAALLVAGVFVWLGRAVPGAEGIASYVKAGLGPLAATQAAVLYWANGWIGAVAVGLAAAGAAAFVFPALAEPGARLSFIVVVIWLSVGAAWIGPRFVTRVEGLTLGLGLLPVLLAATAGWFWFRPEVFLGSWNPTHLSMREAVGASALSAFWAFLGMESAAGAAAVVRDPQRNVPRATLLGVAIVAALYMSAAAVILGVLPSETLAKSQAPFADAARATVGAALGAVIALCVLLRTAGCLTAWTLVTVETSRGGADEGVFPRVFRTRTGERASPVNLLTAGAMMTALVLATASPELNRQFATIANTVALLCLYTYVMAALSLTRLARAFPRPQRIAATLNAVAAIGVALLLIMAARPIELGLSVLPVAAALVLHLRLRRRALDPG